MNEIKPNTPNGQGHVYGVKGGKEQMYGYQYTGHEMYTYGTMPMGYGYGYQSNQAPMMHGYNHGYNQGYAPAYGYGGGVWSSMGTILVLFILLVIISKTMFI
ncbi:hypothetical protein PAECIP112173_04143 [Paenibacillus sp. JJ-100]|nr:hypothetical protein PAECIP112173_04143 [Paenibacillus sp. JJ-100]